MPQGDFFTPLHEVINYKVFHGWGRLDQSGKSLLGTFALDHSQRLMFLQCSCDRGHENKSCGKRNQSSDCCAITQPNNRHINFLPTLINNQSPAHQLCTYGSQERLTQPVTLNSHYLAYTSLIRSGSVLPELVDPLRSRNRRLRWNITRMHTCTYVINSWFKSLNYSHRDASAMSTVMMHLLCRSSPIFYN